MKERKTRDWALLYASLGWRVFPVVPGGKRPLYRGWQRDATTGPELVGRFWRSEPGPNIGLICGEAFDALDVEAAHLQRFGAWLRAYEHQLPSTPIARTGRGGIHILVGVGHGAGRTLHIDGVHIGELKSTGGFIVACPSRTRGTYEWLRGPEHAGVAPTPGWVSELAGLRPTPSAAPTPAAPLGPGRGQARLAALARTVRAATEGSRNSLLYWATRRAVDDGIPAAVTAGVLSRMAASAGLDQGEIEATIRSAQGADRR